MCNTTARVDIETLVRNQAKVQKLEMSVAAIEAQVRAMCDRRGAKRARNS